MENFSTIYKLETLTQLPIPFPACLHLATALAVSMIIDFGPLVFRVKNEPLHALSSDRFFFT
jgi:hypothetical protein